MTTIPKIFLSTVLASAAFSAQAETQLHPIVTASRIAQSTDQTLAAVTVITREDIDHSQSQTVADLLRNRVPGMDFLTTGGTGHQTSAFLRGTSSDQLLFIIDGNIVGSATTGASAIELIPLEQIERIEIIRGPRSALYGSDAIGGVIQVFTRSGGDQYNASVTYGSHNTQAVTVGSNISGESTQLNISASHYKTKGFDVTNDGEDDDDGHSNNAANINIKQSIGQSSNIHASVLYAKGETEFDNKSYDNVSDSIQQSYTLGFDTSLNNDWSTSFDAGQSKDRLETLRYNEDLDPMTWLPLGTFSPSESLFQTKRDQARWQNDLSLGETIQVSFGVDYINDKVESTTTFAETERDNKALYALIQDKFGKHQIQLSGRVDDNEAFGVHRTGNIAWSYDVSGEEQISLSHGTAFIAPSFNDLYYVDFFFNGNPDLEPEISRSTELGFTGNHGWGQWEARAYHTLIKNLIVLNDTFSSVENADKAEINGIEFEVSGKTAGWDNQINLSFIDTKDKDTGNALQGRAARTLKMNVAKNFDSYRFGVHLLAQSPRFANSSNTVELAGYAVVNLTVEKSIDKNWMLKTRLENVLDKEYSTSIDFYGNTTNNTPISLFVTLSYLN
ncbi:MAG: TonB-dependent receptor [Gammaproteobacteria bacterium]|nr:TonB-dependent receptor [Gammaproteobacteria bacterium]MCK5262294.1 TonB-dependent receptor [Gammaproteobacteria bacterium]